MKLLKRNQDLITNKTHVIKLVQQEYVEQNAVSDVTD